MTAWTLCLTTSPKLIKELDTSANTQFKLIAIGQAQLSGLCGIVAELRKVLKQFYRDLYFQAKIYTITCSEALPITLRCSKKTGHTIQTKQYHIIRF